MEVLNTWVRRALRVLEVPSAGNSGHQSLAGRIRCSKEHGTPKVTKIAKDLLVAVNAGFLYEGKVPGDLKQHSTLSVERVQIDGDYA